MMWRTSALALVGILAIVPTATAYVSLPIINKVECSTIIAHDVTATAGFDECIFIKKSNGNRYAGLNYYNGKTDIMNGTLLTDDGRSDTGAPVAVTVDPISVLGFVYLSLSDYPTKTQFTAMYVQIDTGVGHILGIHRPDLEALIKNAPCFHQNQTLPVAAGNPETIAPISSKGYQIRHQFVVDLNFVENVGQVDDSLDRIMVHSNVYYNQPSFVTKFQLITNPQPIHVQRRWVAGAANLVSFQNAIDANPDWPDADAYTLLSYDDGTSYGLLGLGNVGSVCHPERAYRSSIVEYLGNELDTAIAMVHEIGHSLGLAHDFLVANQQEVIRRSSSGDVCTDDGGIMDYNQEYSRWSPCSTQDFKSYYYSLKSFCLLEIGELPTTPPPTTTTPRPTIPTGPCVDYWDDCKQKNHLCNNDWKMTEHCLATCQYCRDGPSTCVDIWGTDTCERRKAVTGCSIVSEALTCRKSCNLCQ